NRIGGRNRRKTRSGSSSIAGRPGTKPRASPPRTRTTGYGTANRRATTASTVETTRSRRTISISWVVWLAAAASGTAGGGAAWMRATVTSGRCGARCASGPVLPRGDVRRLLGRHLVERDPEGRELEPGDLGVDRLRDDVDLRRQLGMVADNVFR